MRSHQISELPHHLGLLQPELQASPFSFVLLLGSAAEGLPYRDLDLGFWSDAPESDLLNLALVWGDRLERAVGEPVDLVPLQAASLGFQHQASKGQVLLCRDEERFAEWKESVWNRYFALQPHFRQHARDLLSG